MSVFSNVINKQRPVKYAINNVNKTMFNTTHLELRIEYIGACCVRQIHCTNATPVCDSNGQLHATTCDFEYEQCIRQHKTQKRLGTIECLLNNNIVSCNIEKAINVAMCQCNLACESTPLNAVCDNTGHTHASWCHFTNAKCAAHLLFVCHCICIKHFSDTM
jgi:hypothetical protein